MKYKKLDKPPEIPLWAQMGHRKPTTRREFLGYGLIPFAAHALVPGALGLLTAADAEAQAANCASGGSNHPAFITLNLAGGAALSANYLPLDAGGAPLASYSKMGQGSGANIPARVSEMGNGNFATNSQFLAGLRERASADARARTAFVAICVQSRDDSGENMFDASGMAFRAGIVGSSIANLGTRRSATGLNQKPSTIAPPPPLIVSNMGSLVNSIGYSAALASGMTAAQREKVAKLASSLSGSQARRLASINSAAHVQDLVSCAGIKNVDLVRSGASAVDPLLDSQFGNQIGQLYGINQNTQGENRIFSAMAYNAMKGTAGTVNLERGGYDYHNGSRTTGDNADNQAGQAVGRILQMAHIMSKPVFIYVTSDGSVVSTDSASAGSNWVSDRGSAGMAYLIMYNPNGRPVTTAPQIGHYNAGQVADGGSPVGSSPAVAAQAAFANYAKFAFGAQWESIFSRVIPRGGALDGAALASIVKVA